MELSVDTSVAKGSTFARESDLQGLIQNLQAVRPGSAGDASGRENMVGRVLREYRLLDVLGEGGMGQVFRARHTSLNKVVAVKVIRSNGSATKAQVARFQREMQAIGQLDHPNIIRALDAGQVDGISYLSMEFVDGTDLAKVILKNGSLNTADAAEIIRQIAEGLHYAHQRGLIHRDIKPSNLMLARDSIGDVGVKILDLGLALIEIEAGADERLTDAGHALGTLRFMSPEQAEDTHGVDYRADIYSLGVTAYQLLTRTIPFSLEQYGSPAKFLRALTSADAPSVETHRAGLSTRCSPGTPTNDQRFPKSSVICSHLPPTPN